MSATRKYLPLALAIVLGIGNGYYAFNPSLKEEHDRQQNRDIHSASPSQQPMKQGASPASESMAASSSRSSS